MSPDLVNLTIDGVPVAVPKGTAIIEAAKQAGVLVPHYCYHPSLPSPAVCRMCLVEVGKSPKRMPASVRPAEPQGSVVHVHSDSRWPARGACPVFLHLTCPRPAPFCPHAGGCGRRAY